MQLLRELIQSRTLLPQLQVLRLQARLERALFLLEQVVVVFLQPPQQQVLPLKLVPFQLLADWLVVVEAVPLAGLSVDPMEALLDRHLEVLEEGQKAQVDPAVRMAERRVGLLEALSDQKLEP